MHNHAARSVNAECVSHVRGGHDSGTGMFLAKEYSSNSMGDGPPECNASRARAYHIDLMATWKSHARVRADIRDMPWWAALDLVDGKGTVRRTWQMSGDQFELERAGEPPHARLCETMPRAEAASCVTRITTDGPWPPGVRRLASLEGTEARGHPLQATKVLRGRAQHERVDVWCARTTVGKRRARVAPRRRTCL